MSAKAFDPVVYKETTRRQWQDAAAAWDRWSEVLERWLGPATEVMLDVAGIRQGSRVLDVAAGECLRFEQESFGALHLMLAGLSDDARADAWAEIEQALGRFQRRGGFEAPCELIVASGTR